jgi:hypothetical protein
MHEQKKHGRTCTRTRSFTMMHWLNRWARDDMYSWRPMMHPRSYTQTTQLYAVMNSIVPRRRCLFLRKYGRYMCANRNVIMRDMATKKSLRPNRLRRQRLARKRRTEAILRQAGNASFSLTSLCGRHHMSRPSEWKFRAILRLQKIRSMD